MTQPSPPALTPEQEALAATLRLDFLPSDLGDVESRFEGRLRVVVIAATSRKAASAAQMEAGARHALVSAQIRQMLRVAEEQKGASGASFRQDLASKLAALQLEQRQLLTLSGLDTARPPRLHSMSLDVETFF